ncbi:uncharacterized protein LOC132277899 [Cornus florida]|uniref:uncharacterized protein LOC132277899 n=1 Tax=Cornus florida TaxID=4283 RepID=UPI00289F30D7|nr:uncharacterized protein LOC132277899 [Cornus florida]
MLSHAAALQRACVACQKCPDTAEILELEPADWRIPFIRYLQHGHRPDDPALTAKLKHQASRFQLCDGQLFPLSREGDLLRCLAGAEIYEALHQAHSLEHQGAYKLFQHLIHKGLYWPTMEYDVKTLVQQCKPC